jgi:hypothetical protein
MTLLLAMSTCSVAFAGNPDDPAPNHDENEPRATDSMTFAVSRTSATTANVTVRVSYSTKVDQCNVVVYLQKLVNGDWVTDTSNADSVIDNYDNKVYSYTFSNVYTKLTRGETYRVRVVSKDYINGNSTTMIGYSRSF